MTQDILESKVAFKCAGDNFEAIPKNIVEENGICFPVAHTNKEDISLLARKLKDYRKDSICRIPFCATVEAEAIGANIKLGDEKTGPRVDSYVYSSIEELENIKEIDLNKGRIEEVLCAVEDIKKHGEIVCLNVEGPFTIISSLVDPMIFYRGIRKNRDIVDNFIKVIEDSTVKYMLEGIKRGADIISFADPAGAMDIVGPKMYKDVSGKISLNILKKVQPFLNNSIIHLCGKTSTAFEQLGFCESAPIEFDENLTYGQALLKLLEQNNDIKIIGHWCIKRTPIKKRESVIWRINLK
ncbi:uroporphyrinogen decarboxylase family protein [Clostridium sp. KNHs214]|uniref:uroporphyrinogen decarboxylase family protein n=1 Tax=Clostridium sp. KNHs214 TaxID=1540257 RepID=UPI0006904FD8|nr:uroporphyrinogen decarboxylase family protein [Clostridium sp. KNHs214]